LKNQLLSSVAVTAIALGFGVPAQAQAPASYNWSGFYIGLNAGAAFGRSKASTSPDCSLAAGPAYICDNVGLGADNAAAVSASGSGTITDTGFTGGLQAGYNFQRNNMVYGLETDYGAFKLNGSRLGSGRYLTTVGPAPGDAYTMGSSFSANWLFTLRGRLGTVVMPNLMVYATGGLALTRLTVGNAYTDQAGLANMGAGSSSSSAAKTGWVLGGGLEWALTNNWSVKGEYLYVDFGKVTTTLNMSDPGGYAQAISTSSGLSAHVARAGINYRF
jgi:outer membrane immunogenic protein